MTKDDTINALGFIEVRGLAAAIETADAMLKSAQVRLLRQLLRDPMQTTLTVEGTLGACSAAVDAGRAAAQRMDAFVACQVMGRPAQDTADFVLKLAEAGRAPFGPPLAKAAAVPLAKPAVVPLAKATALPAATASPAPAAKPATSAVAKATRPAPDDDALLAALAGLPGGYGAQSLARRLGGTSAEVRARLDALCSRGKLVKRGSRYLLAKPGGANK